LNLKLQIRANSTATQPETYVRVLVLRDKQPASGTVGPIYADLFDFPQTLPASGDSDQTRATMALSMMTRRHTNNRIAGRFQWLYDRWFKVSNEAGTGHEVVTINKIINIFKPTHFGDLPSDGDRGPGQLYLYLISNEGKQPTTAWPAVDWSSRLSFTDC